MGMRGCFRSGCMAIFFCANAVFAQELLQEGQKAAPKKALSSAEYGTLYVLDQKDAEVSDFRVSLGYVVESGNPYRNVQGFSQNIEKSFERFFWAGIQATEFFSSPTTLMSTLQNDLAVRGINVQTASPSYSIYGTLAAVPLSGHLAFFGKSAMQTELWIRVGAGRVAYQAGTPALGLFWSVRPTIYLMKALSAQMGLTQEFERPFVADDGLTRLRADVNVGFHF